jgi:uncharacterized cupredoxin-like copper-binding protein
MKFSSIHMASLCRYTGISFTAGAVTHGVFSEHRSLVTALLGVSIYLLGAVLEKLTQPEKSQTWTNLLFVGILASVGLGFFTGGLQHFPDSPDRSAWVVPLGFVMSWMALYWLEGRGHMRVQTIAIYGAVSTSLVLLLSFMAWKMLGAGGHGQEDHHAQPSTPASFASALRDIHIEMDDNMRFSPATWSAVQGEAVRIHVKNNGKLVHELVIGREAELREHAQAMKQGNLKDMHHDNEVSVKPGQSRELIVIFHQAGEWQMACLEDGHFEAGMKGVIVVTPPNVSAPSASTPAKPFAKPHVH